MFLALGILINFGVGAGVIGSAVSAEIYWHTPGRETTVPALTYLLRAAGLAALGAIAVAGLLAFTGATALLGVGLLAACSPVVLRRLPARAPQTLQPPQPRMAAPSLPAATGTPPLPVMGHSLSDAELCWQWRTCFGVLQRAVSPGERLAVLQTRAGLLDELAHRDPEGFARWLNSGARAASDPARYLTSMPSSPQLPPQRRDPPR
jgi:hypothetical protein